MQGLKGGRDEVQKRKIDIPVTSLEKSSGSVSGQDVSGSW